jgi:F-box protein 11
MGLLNPATLLKQRYRIVRKIGEGGFSAVYLAKDLFFNDAPRVVKEMSMQPSGSQLLDPQEVQQAIASFQQEAMLLAGLAHPNFPRIYDYFEQQQRWYIVMDYIEGQTLEDRLAQAPGGKLSLGQVLPLTLQLCTVLAYLHSQRSPIIFRDLKPANIMVTVEDHVYLIDFGIARLFKPGQANDTVALGSPGYAAPEQYGRSQSTPLTDIYSLGATLHQLLSGQDPSDTPFQFASLTMLDQEPGGPAVAALIERMVQIPQSQRPQTIQEVKQGLQGAQGAQGVPLYSGTGQANSATGGASIGRPVTGSGRKTVIVALTGGDYTSISEALQQVPEKTRIMIRPGIYLESLVLAKQVELVGDGPRDQIVLIGQQDSCVRMITNMALVHNLTIRGQAQMRATVDILQGQLVMDECTITSETGVCIHIQNPNTRPIVQRCIIRGSSQAGILLSDQGGGSIEDCDIFANATAGIGVTTRGAPVVRGCKIHDSKGHGIVVAEQGAGTFEDCDIFANAEPGIGITTRGAPVVRGCKIHDSKGLVKE